MMLADDFIKGFITALQGGLADKFSEDSKMILAKNDTIILWFFISVLGFNAVKDSGWSMKFDTSFDPMLRLS
ncbi:MAG: hypothetical protein JSS95_11900 [Acidobacteria bacterium]|nr:hypothetical protein [Acidobacteriota bacterium]